MKRYLLWLPAVILLGVTSGIATAQEAANAASPPATQELDKADIAWMLIASALVFLMVPGLALFYGGMVRRKNILATMMHSMVAIAIVGVWWVAIGYCLAFGETWRVFGESWGGIIGWSPEKLFFLKGVEPGEVLNGTHIPIYLHVMYQGMFAIITPALISGAIAERIRFWPYCVFLLLWVTFIYCPIAHMVWAMDWWKGDGSHAVGLLVPGQSMPSTSRAASLFMSRRACRAWPRFSCCASVLATRNTSCIPAAWSSR